jgi:excisionase family DNA binding protein
MESLAIPAQSATAADCMTAAQVAALLQIPTRTVQEYAARGVLPGVRIGRHWRFSRCAIERIYNPEVTSK